MDNAEAEVYALTQVDKLIKATVKQFHFNKEIVIELNLNVKHSSQLVVQMVHAHFNGFNAIQLNKY
jgi:hypothetical protein